MKDIMTCSLDELLPGKQLAVQYVDISIYMECIDIINTMYTNFEENRLFKA